MKKTFFIILSFAVAISCSETLRPDSDNIGINQQQEISVPDYHIGLENALESLDGFIAAINGTKSGTLESRIANIIRLGRQPGAVLKSEDDTDMSTLLYIVNFKDSAGYAVLAADSRLPTDIYALTEAGNADEEDFLSGQDGAEEDFNPLDLIYRSALHGNISTGRDTTLIPCPDPTIPIGDTLQNIYIGEWVITQWGPWNTSASYPAMLMTQWGQGSPYKDMTGAQDAGCGVTAVAQMMAYNQYPALLDDIRIPYDTLRKMKHVYTNSDYADDVAILFKHIFKGCKTKPFLGGMLTWPKNIVPYLKELGYKNVDIYKHPSKCDTDMIYSSLDKGYPALVTATTDELVGHTWVIDGYIKQYRTGTKVGEETGKTYGTDYESREFMHCNWGWDGDKDGYFYSGIFDSNRPSVIPTTKGESDGYYRSYYRIITYEIPQ